MKSDHTRMIAKKQFRSVNSAVWNTRKRISLFISMHYVRNIRSIVADARVHLRGNIRNFMIALGICKIVKKLSVRRYKG